MLRELSAALIALTLLASGCGARGDSDRQASVTVKLPPPRPATPRPGFSFDAPGGTRSPRAAREL
jgi:hypothetical protein